MTAPSSGTGGKANVVVAPHPSTTGGEIGTLVTEVLAIPPSATGSRIDSMAKQGAVDNATGKIADPPSTTGGGLGNASGTPIITPENVTVPAPANQINKRNNNSRCTRYCS